MSGELNQAARGGMPPNLLECMAATPYDEMLEYDLINDRCRNLHHTEGKYFVPIPDGGIEMMCHFAAENMIHPDDRDAYLKFIDPQTMLERLRKSSTPGLLMQDLRYKLLDGSWSWTRKLLVAGAAFGLPDSIVRGFIYDIQSDRSFQEDKNQYFSSKSNRDERTGLLTDRELYPQARRKLSRITGEWCVIAIDIEHFRLFADWHGRAAADALMTQIGLMLKRVEQDTGGLAGHRGQNDFWLVIPYDLRMINGLYDELRELIVSHGNSVGFLPIFGICMINPQEDIAEIFNHAALTAEQVKGDLHNRIRIYNPAVYQRTVEEYSLLSDFQKSLENNELFFCLQPQCRISNGRVVGAESLARWRLPDGSMVPPAKFVPILEKYGMVTNLDQHIWEGVCAWLRKWIDQGHTPVPISVNVSQIDLLTIDVPDYFASMLKKYELPAKLLKVEITESAYVEDAAKARDAVRRLRAMGMLVLMDDFGSGYSSLNMLRSLNVDILKLDAQFLHIGSMEERKGISIVESVVNMAKTMSLPVIVEGVETQEQINFLEDLGCSYIQGYYFYRPMLVDEFERLIGDERHVDQRGIEFKSNEQIHPREFLDENVFSDAMLNNILGPVAFYRWKAKSVDIVRYNQQFYQMVGISQHQMEARRFGIQEFFYSEDRERFNKMLENAMRDRLNGAKGVVRVYRPNGSLRWISMQLYFLSEGEDGRMYYGSCEDVTELQFINVDLPGGYHRVTADERMEFRYISENFRQLTGYTDAEIQNEFGNQMIRMVHPDDVALVLDNKNDVLAARRPSSEPFRLRNKQVGYIYVTDQQISTDLYGEVCLMGIVGDVTDMVKTRANMQLLADFSTDSIALVQKTRSGYRHHLLVYGMEKKLGMRKSEFARALNSGAYNQWVDSPEREKLEELMREKIEKREPAELEYTLHLPNGQMQPMRMKIDRIKGQNDENTEYICLFHAV